MAAIATQATKSGIAALAKLFAILMLIGFVGIIGVVILSEMADRQTNTSSSAGSLVVLVHTGTRGVRITNDTDVAWDYCTAVLAGSYEASFGVLNRRASVELYYKDFSVGSTALNEDDGFARAIRSTSVTCTGSDDKRHQAIVR